MSCIAPLSSALRSVSRLVWWPFKLAATATTLLLLRLLALALRSLTPTASTPPTDIPFPKDAPFWPDNSDDDYLDDHSFSDFDPNDPDDPWNRYLNDPSVIHQGRHHIARCYQLDPSRHSH